MIRSLLLAGLLATTANAQVAVDTVRENRGAVFAQRVFFSAPTSAFVSAYPFLIAAYSAEPTPMIVASGFYVTMVAVTTAAVAGRHSRCVYGERFQRSFVGGLVGIGVATMIVKSVHGTHMKGWSAVIPVSGILLATPVGAASGAAGCDRDVSAPSSPRRHRR